MLHTSTHKVWYTNVTNLLTLIQSDGTLAMFLFLISTRYYISYSYYYDLYRILLIRQGREKLVSKATC